MLLKILGISAILNVVLLIAFLVTPKSFPGVSKFFLGAFFINLVIGCLLLIWITGPPG